MYYLNLNGIEKHRNTLPGYLNFKTEVVFCKNCEFIIKNLNKHVYVYLRFDYSFFL